MAIQSNFGDCDDYEDDDDDAGRRGTRSKSIRCLDGFLIFGLLHLVRSARWPIISPARSVGRAKRKRAKANGNGNGNGKKKKKKKKGADLICMIISRV